MPENKKASMENAGIKLNRGFMLPLNKLRSVGLQLSPEILPCNE
jgi:hypothetical protein